jgi:hypothetical protein
MRIKKVRLKNGYKRFRDLTINLGDKPARVVALVAGRSLWWPPTTANESSRPSADGRDRLIRAGQMQATTIATQLFRQIHLAQERLEAGVLREACLFEFGPNIEQKWVPLSIGASEPLHGFI